MQRLIALLLVLLATSPTLAWNDMGHKIVAQIAYAELTPVARKKMMDILKQHPRYQQDLLKGLPEGHPDPELYAFAKAATWPDMIRDKLHPLHNSQHRAKWHYVNFAVSPEEGKDWPGPDRNESVLIGIRTCVSDLKSNQEMTATDKAMRLCWLAHLVGDLHQPLHATAFFSKDFPKGDLGGNLYEVRNTGGRINLHKLWDEILGGAESHKIIAQHVKAIVSEPKRQREALAESLKRKDCEEWALESVADAREHVYLKLQLPGANVSKKVALDDVPMLPDGYEANARDVARRRMALAGYRLADVLNELYKE